MRRLVLIFPLIIVLLLTACGGGGGGGGAAIVGGGGGAVLGPVTVALRTSATAVGEARGARSRAVNRALGEATITAQLSRVWSTDVIVDIKGVGTAVGGVDYLPLPDIVIPAGSLEGSVQFVPIDNNTYSGNKSCRISIVSIVGGVVEQGGTESQALDLTIEEDETLSLQVSDSSIAEDSSGVITLSATLSAPAAENFTVGLGSSGNATEGVFFTAIPDIIIPAGAATASTTFSPIDNDFYDGDLSSTIFINGVQGGSLSPKPTQSVTVSFTEDDSRPIITFSSSGDSISESGGGSLMLSASLDRALRTSLNVSVSQDVASVARETADFLTLEDISIPAGQFSGNTIFLTTDDDIYEGGGVSESAKIELSVSGRTDVVDTTNVIDIAIIDDDSEPTVTLRSGSASNLKAVGAVVSIKEGEALASGGPDNALTAILSNPTDQEVTVDLSTGFGTTATLGEDFSSLASITIPAEETLGSTSLIILDDNIYEKRGLTESINVGISSVSNASIDGEPIVHFLIEETDERPLATLSISPSVLKEDEGPVTLTVSLPRPTDEDFFFYFNHCKVVSECGAAAPGTDYLDDFHLVQQVIPSGQTSISRPFVILNSEASEEDEFALLNISAPGGQASAVAGGGIGFGRARLDIINVGPSVSLSIDKESIEEGSETVATVTATLSEPVDVQTIVSLSFVGTGVHGADFVLSSGSSFDSITIPAGESSSAISFSAIDNDEEADDKEVTVAISSVSGGRNASEAGDQVKTFAIVNDDVTPSLNFTVDAGAISEESEGSLSLIATLNKALDNDVVVNCFYGSETYANSATGGVDFTVGSQFTIPAGDLTGSTSFTVIDDDVFEKGEEIARPGCSTVANPDLHQINGGYYIKITDEELPPKVAISSDSDSVPEGGGANLTISLSTPTYEDVSVSLTGTGVAQAGTDYQLTTDLVIPAGETSVSVPISAITDGIDEKDESLSIDVSTIVGGSATENGEQKVDILIVDVSAPNNPLVTLTASAGSTSENGESIVLTATLSEAAIGDVVINFSTTGSGSVASDFVGFENLTIESGQLSANIELIPLDDLVYEGDESVTVSISSVSGGGASESGEQSVLLTLIENELIPTITISSDQPYLLENSNDSSTITATLSGPVAEDLTIALTADGSATEGVDYETLPNIVIPAGSLTSSISFDAIDDQIDEDDETIVISIGSISGVSGLSLTSTVSVSLINRGPWLTLTAVNSNVLEGVSGSKVRASIEWPLNSDLTVRLGLASQNGSGDEDTVFAVEGVDYVALSDIIIPAGSTQGETPFVTINDGIHKPTRTAAISANSFIGPHVKLGGTARFDIFDDEPRPNVTISADSSEIFEDGDRATVTIALSYPTYEPVYVTLSTSGSASLGSDYELSTVVTIPAGQTSALVELVPISDELIETDETAVIEIQSVSGGNAIENTAQSVSIQVSDNDSGPTVILGVSGSTTSISETGTNLQIIATLSEVLSEDVTVVLQTSGTATEGADYTTLENIIIAAGSLTGTVSFTPIADEISESSESAILEIATVSGGGAVEAGEQSKTITIFDIFETHVSLSIVGETTKTATVAENSATPVTVTVSLSIATSEDVSVTFSTAGSAIEGVDYGAFGVATIPAGQTSTTVSFVPIDDAIYEGVNEAVALSILSITGGGAVEDTPQGLTLIIAENEVAPTVSISSSSSSISESGESVSVTATLTHPTFETVTVAFTQSGVATMGEDYNLSTTSIEIPAGDISASLTLVPIDDGVPESNESIIFSIQSVSGGDASEQGEQSISISLINAAVNPTVTLIANGSSVFENESHYRNVSVVLSEATTVDVTISFSTSGTAVEGVDYNTINDVTIPAGQTAADFLFRPVDDGVYEGVDEVAVIQIESITGDVTQNGSQSIAITINESRAKPTVGLLMSPSCCTSESGADVSIVATLSGLTSFDVTVVLSVSGTATEGVDYATLEDIVIPAGSLTGSVALNPTPDNEIEDYETAIIGIDSITNGLTSHYMSNSLGLTKAVGIADSAPSASVSLSILGQSGKTGTVIENSGNTITVVTSLTTTQTQDVTITFNTAGSATKNVDYGLPGSVTISAGQLSSSITFTPIDDDLYEGVNEAVALSIASISGGDVASSVDQGLTLIITENESAPTVTLSSSQSVVDESGEDVSVTATLSHPTFDTVTVFVTTSGNAENGNDYVLSTDLIQIPAGEVTGTAIFNPTEDGVAEGIETVILTIHSVSGGDVTLGVLKTTTITLLNDAANPTVTLVAGDSLISEGGSFVLLTLNLSEITSSDVTVSLSTTGTATSAEDFVALSSLTIAAGQSSASIPFTPIDDTFFEGDESVTISVSTVEGGNATEEGQQSVDITIAEDEPIPNISLSAINLTLDEKTGASTVLTATTDTLVDEDVFVGLTFSGSATFGTDYSVGTVTLVIPSGEFTKSVNVSALPDTRDEGGSETLSVAISSVNIGNKINSPVSISIIEDALNSGTQHVFVAEDTEFFRGYVETTNIEFLSPNQSFEPSPYETINLPEAFGYGLGGAGQLIAIMDGGFWVSESMGVTHPDLDGKNIEVFGILAPADSSGNFHGTSVASVAAGDIFDGVGIHGVAPFADLHLSDVFFNSTAVFDPDHWANATNDAASLGAVVQNNSWGIDVTITSIQQEMIIFNETALETLAWNFNASGSSASIASVQNYVNALNNFQNSGVVVFALSNEFSLPDADYIAALPELFPELGEAWITAVNIDVTGSNFIRRSAPCGQTADYCLGADGWNITTAGGMTAETQWIDNFGTSFVAPQISGAVALLSEHFPNHTPEQIVDRLLATADNTFFTADGTTTFSNGVTHGYSNEFGHGVMNIFAALQPVTTTSASTRIFTGATTVSGDSSSIFETGLKSSRSFGDSIGRALATTSIQFYDALNGAFEIQADTFSIPTDTSTPVLNLGSAMSSIGFVGDAAKDGALKRNPIKGALYTLSNEEKDGGFVVTFNQGNPSTQALFGDIDTPFDSLRGLRLPYLKPAEQGVGVSYVDSFDEFRFSVSSNTPVRRSDEEYFGDKNNHAAAVEYNGDKAAVSVVTGISEEKDNLFGSMGSGAFEFSGSKTDTTFVGTRVGLQLGEKSSINYHYAAGHTSYEGPSDSLLHSAELKSDAYLMSFDVNPTEEDRVSLFVSSPNRVNGGSITLKLTNLADSDGNLTYRHETLGLDAVGRQQDMGISYKRNLFSKENVLSMQLVRTSQPNHIESAESVYSGFVGLGLGRFKTGIAYDELSNSVSSRIDYSINF